MSYQGFQDCLVIERADGWWIVVNSETEHVASDASPDELATCIGLMIKLSGLKRPSCVLAPASESCYFARLDVGEEIDLRDRVALGYELEDHLPIDAESTVSDFVVVPPGAERERSVAAVAVEIGRWRAIADAIESAGIAVRSIVPAAVLATRSISIEDKVGQRADYLLVQDARCDWITTHSKAIVAWKHLRADAETLRRHKLIDAVESETLVVVGASESQRAMIAEACGEVEHSPESVEFHELRGAELALSNQGGRWFDLRRDALGPADPLRPVKKHLQVVTAAAAFCLLAIAAGGWWRSQRIDQQIAGIESQQRERFQQAFPGARVPGALLRRVRSEHASFMASRLTAARSGSDAINLPVSAPDVLRQLLGALPQDVRFRITKINVLDGQVDLELEVRSPVDAGALATSISVAGFDVKPPTTSRKDARTFDSTVEAEWIGLSPADSSSEEVSVRVSVRKEANG